MSTDGPPVGGEPALPSSADAARALLPAMRLAGREKFGRVRMAFLSPLLLVLLRIAGELLMKFLAAWLEKQRSAATALPMLLRAWDRDAMPEVKAGLARAARGETGE